MKFKAVSFGLMLLLSMLNGVKSDCNYYQEMKTGQTYYVFNNDYPDKYQGKNHCTWKLKSSNTIKVNCTIDIPSSKNCFQDSLSIQFAGSNMNKYCGSGIVVQKGEKDVTIELNTTAQTRGGNFLCLVTAEGKQCQCGRKNPTTKIVGGKETGINEFPMMAGIVDIREKLIFCGATIISQEYLTTAAHCVHNKSINEIAVIVGEHDVTTGSETNATKLYRLSNCFIHPEYNPRNIHYDIAVCKTEGLIKFSNKVSSVCLPFQHNYDSFGGEIVTALGWGLLEFAEAKADKLQKVDLNIMNRNECKATAPSVNSQTNLCTYTEGKDACQMDSGGPLLWENPTSHNIILIGIISAGIGCAGDDPAFHVRTGAFIDWIVSVTPGVQYCKAE